MPIVRQPRAAVRSNDEALEDLLDKATRMLLEAVASKEGSTCFAEKPFADSFMGLFLLRASPRVAKKAREELKGVTDLQYQGHPVRKAIFRWNTCARRVSSRSVFADLMDRARSASVPRARAILEHMRQNADIRVGIYPHVYLRRVVSALSNALKEKLANATDSTGPAHLDPNPPAAPGATMTAGAAVAMEATVAVGMAVAVGATTVAAVNHPLPLSLPPRRHHEASSTTEQSPSMARAPGPHSSRLVGGDRSSAGNVTTAARVDVGAPGRSAGRHSDPSTVLSAAAAAAAATPADRSVEPSPPHRHHHGGSSHGEQPMARITASRSARPMADWRSSGGNVTTAPCVGGTVDLAGKGEHLRRVTVSTSTRETMLRPTVAHIGVQCILGPALASIGVQAVAAPMICWGSQACPDSDAVHSELENPRQQQQQVVRVNDKLDPLMQRVINVCSEEDEREERITQNQKHERELAVLRQEIRRLHEHKERLDGEVKRMRPVFEWCQTFALTNGMPRGTSSSAEEMGSGPPYAASMKPSSRRVNDDHDGHRDDSQRRMDGEEGSRREVGDARLVAAGGVLVESSVAASQRNEGATRPDEDGKNGGKGEKGGKGGEKVFVDWQEEIREVGRGVDGTLVIDAKERTLPGAPDGDLYMVEELYSTDITPSTCVERDLQSVKKFSANPSTKPWAATHNAVNSLRRLVLHHGAEALAKEPRFVEMMVQLARNAVQSIQSKLAKNGLRCLGDMLGNMGAQLAAGEHIEGIVVDMAGHLRARGFMATEAEKALEAGIGVEAPEPVIRALTPSLSCPHPRTVNKAAVLINRALLNIGVGDTPNAGLGEGLPADLLQALHDGRRAKQAEGRAACNEALARCQLAMGEASFRDALATFTDTATAARVAEAVKVGTAAGARGASLGASAGRSGRLKAAMKAKKKDGTTIKEGGEWECTV